MRSTLAADRLQLSPPIDTSALPTNEPFLSMELWADAFDSMNTIDGEFDSLTVDQQIKIAEIKVLLAIEQELSLIHHQGINPNTSPEFAEGLFQIGGKRQCSTLSGECVEHCS